MDIVIRNAELRGHRDAVDIVIEKDHFNLRSRRRRAEVDRKSMQPEVLCCPACSICIFTLISRCLVRPCARTGRIRCSPSAHQPSNNVRQHIFCQRRDGDRRHRRHPSGEMRVPEDISVIGSDDVPIARWPSYESATILSRSRRWWTYCRNSGARYTGREAAGA